MGPSLRRTMKPVSPARRPTEKPQSARPVRKQQEKPKSAADARRRSDADVKRRSVVVVKRRSVVVVKKRSVADARRRRRSAVNEKRRNVLEIFVPMTLPLNGSARDLLESKDSRKKERRRNININETWSRNALCWSVNAWNVKPVEASSFILFALLLQLLQ